MAKNLIFAVPTDTNGDGFLGKGDIQNLYVSDYNGANDKLVLTEASELELIRDNQVIIKQGNGNSARFYIYDVVSGALHALANNL